MKRDWIDLGPLADFPAEAPVLRKEGGHRYACVRLGDEVHALDDRCPHQGYPLSQGDVKGGVLTCAWHNWKFELGSGACAFGGEPVRRYPTRVEDGRVHLDRAIDTAAEARRLVAGLRAALFEDAQGRALREALRLAELDLGPAGAALGPLYAAFEVLAHDGAERAEWGFDHGLAVLADLCSWVERGVVPAEEAFVAAAHAIGEPNAHLGARGAKGGAGPAAQIARIADFEEGDVARVAEALAAERRDEAEARVRAIVEVRGAEAACRALLPFVSRHLYDYGHGAIFLSKALELARRFPAAAAPLFAASTVELAWATAETSLPPFAATQAAMARLGEISLDAAGAAIAWDRRSFEEAVLAGEKTACDATLARLAEGCDPVALLRATAHAAAVRLSRFDVAWESRLDAEVGVLDVTHAVTFAEAAIALAPLASPRESAQLALLAAAFVGKLRKGDAADPPRPAEGASGGLVAAAEARDLGRALAIARDLDGPARLAAYAELAPFAAFDAATRPIFYAHTVKNAEALRRLEAADPEADGAYLAALLAFIVPARRETRFRRTAAVARKFLRDGRPPEGLY